MGLISAKGLPGQEIEEAPRRTGRDLGPDEIALLDERGLLPPEPPKAVVEVTDGHIPAVTMELARRRAIGEWRVWKERGVMRKGQVLSAPLTWWTDEDFAKVAAYGKAPPAPGFTTTDSLELLPPQACDRCGATGVMFESVADGRVRCAFGCAWS
jgi:hypothetical protein